MKNIKFKVLIMFMLLVLVGLGSGSVLATSEQTYYKTTDLYELTGNSSRQRVLKIYQSSGSVITYVLGTIGSEQDVYNELGELFEVFVLDKVIERNGTYIEDSDWRKFVDVFCDVEEITTANKTNILNKLNNIKKYTFVNLGEEIENENPQDYEEGINNFWENAFDWFKGAQSSGGMGTVTDGFMKGATNIIKMVGNMIFIVVTSILGVKYIWGSADAKYSVKNSLFSLVIAAVVFYGWDSISNIIQTVTTSTVGNNIESTTKTIYTYILYFVNIAAIGGIIFLGVKYLLASAEGKSQLKMNMGPAFLGIIMVYATISFLNTILNIFLG